MATHAETERTYDVGDDFVVPDLGYDTAPTQTHELVALYFDTADLRLARRGISLRRRRGGSDQGWHLKLPRGADTKQEVRQPVESEQVPPVLADLLTGLVRGDPLTPVAEITTTRTEHGLRDRSGTVLAELADDHVSARRLPSGRREDARDRTWRELEVELVDGREKVLDDVGRRLCREGARQAHGGSKLARTLGGDLPGTRPEPAGTAGQVLAAAMSRHVDRVLGCDPLVRLADHDDDSVHKMRVGVRRIRSLLRTFRPVLDRTRADALDRELAWLAGSLGRVRDLEVQCALFDRELADLPGTVLAGSRSPGWLIELGRRENQARDLLRADLNSDRYLRLARHLDALTDDLPLTGKATKPARKQTHKILNKALRNTRTAWQAAQHLPGGQERDAQLHKTRKAAKRLRYTADAAKPVLNKARKISRRAERLQDVLGEHHDGVVSIDLLARIARREETNPVEAFDLGLLTGVEQRRREAAADQAHQAAERL